MKRRLRAGIASFGLFLALAAAVSGTALGYFSATGIGSASAGVSKLTAPAVSAIPAAGGIVALSWGAVTAPGPGNVIYSVTRDGGEPAGECPSTSSPAPVISCVDVGLEVGTHTYVVKAKWRSWTVESSTSSAKVTVGPANHLTITAASSTPAAGAADNLTITAKDKNNGTVTTYTGLHGLVFSGASDGPDGTEPTVADNSGAAIAFGGETELNFTAGVASVGSAKNGVMKLYKSGATSIGVSDGSISSSSPLNVTVAAATAAELSLAAETAAPAAGEEDALTITAFDAYGNLATSYTGSHKLTFSGASASPDGTKPTVANSSGTATAFGTATALTFSAGIASVGSAKNGVMKLFKSGSASVKASDGTISSPASLEVSVAPEAAAELSLSAASTAPTAGVADNLTTTAVDEYGNTTPSYTGSHSLTFSGASASPDGTVPTISSSTGAATAFGDATALTFSAGVASVSGGGNGVMKLYKSGSTSVKASDGSISSPNLTVTVAASAAVELSLAAASTTPTAGVADNLTTTALDAYDNTAASYTGSHSLTFSGSSASPSGTLPTVANSSGTATNFGNATAITFTAGVAGVTSTKNGVMKLNRAGPASIAVSDGSISSPAIAVTVSPAAAARFALTNINISAGSLGSTCLFTCTLTGLGNSGTVKAKVIVADSLGNTVSALGAGHAVKVTTNGTGTISGTPLAIPSTGAAETATTFTYTSKSSGTFTEIVTAAASEGTAYTSATLTASR